MTIPANSTPTSLYEADLKKPNFRKDPAQLEAVKHLQRLYDDLVNAENVKTEEVGFFDRLFGKKESPQPLKGLYFWGGVGRGKTYLVDTFYHCLPLEANVEKKRIHFHVFMQEVHHKLKQLREKKDPLELVAEAMVETSKGQRLRVLCFDEFVVADGLQRDLLLPAIDLIYKHTEVVNIDGGIDYRLAFLEKADIYFTPLSITASDGLAYNFSQLAPEEGKPNHMIKVLGRPIQTKRWADGVAWFEFAELCETARSQNDYIEIARRFHSVLLENVPTFDQYKEDSARRLINLIDVFYEYTGRNPQVKFEFDRTVSRLAEMQSKKYLAKAHIS